MGMIFAFLFSWVFYLQGPISEGSEVAMGEAQYVMLQEMDGGPSRNLEAQARVERIGRRVAMVSDRPHLPYEFVVLDNDEPNAWCLPGGKIVINQGFLNMLKTDEQIAFILGHEISHASARHEINSLEKRYTYLGTHPVVELFHDIRFFWESRACEREADALGLTYLARAGYDPKAALRTSSRFVELAGYQKATLFSTHPPPIERYQLLYKKSVTSMTR